MPTVLLSSFLNNIIIIITINIIIINIITFTMYLICLKEIYIQCIQKNYVAYSVSSKKHKAYGKYHQEV